MTVMWGKFGVRCQGEVLVIAVNTEDVSELLSSRWEITVQTPSKGDRLKRKMTRAGWEFLWQDKVYAPKCSFIMNTKGLSGQLEGLSAPVLSSTVLRKCVCLVVQGAQLGNEPSHTVASSVTWVNVPPGSPLPAKLIYITKGWSSCSAVPERCSSFWFGKIRLMVYNQMINALHS